MLEWLPPRIRAPAPHPMIYLALAQNLALLVCLSLVHALMMRKLQGRDLPLKVLSGLFFGTVTLVGMLTPMLWAPGVIFDGRSIVLGVAGLFGGPVPALLAALMAAAFRLHLGGAGAWTGVAVIAASTLIGLGGHLLHRRRPRLLETLPLYLLGLLIHVVMVLLMGLLPGSLTGAFLREVALPVLLLYPLAFMLVGRLFADLESRFRTEASLRASEARNRAILGAIPDMMFVFSRDGRVLDYQVPDTGHLFAPPEAFLGRHLGEAFPPDLSETAIRQIGRVLAQGRMEHIEYVLDLDGPRHYEGRLVPAGPDECLAIVRDITDRKAAEHALVETRALYEDLVTSSLTGIYRLREHRAEAPGRHGIAAFDFDFINDRFCELMDLSRAQLADDAEAVHERIHPEDFPAWQAANQEAVARDVPFVWEGRILSGGQAHWRHFESRPRSLDAHTRLWTGLVIDIDARKRAEAEQQEMERRMLHVQKLESLGVLAGGMAHDFNNLLTAMLGHADLALAKLPPMSPARESLAAIVDAAMRASDLSRQMLAYSGRGKFIIEPIAISDLVAEMLHLLKASISKKAALNLNLERDLPQVDGDATQLRQVLMNLITNASEALGDVGGTITVGTGTMFCGRDYLKASSLDGDLEEGTYVFLEVSDTGCGMDRDTLERIFEPFFSTKFTGRGLGMAAVLGIVRGHKGAIRIYTEPGRGTTFKVLFPARAERGTGAQAATTAGAGLWHGTGTVLLVDDEEMLRDIGERLLRELGFEVLLARDGREALDVFTVHQDRIVLVLLDLTMPYMDGEETFRALRMRDPRVRVLLSSGYTEQEITARFAGKGLAGFIQKPYTLREMARKVQAALGKLPAG